MIYVDATIPIYARGAAHPHRDPCRRALARIVRDEVACCTSLWVLEEIMHRYLALGQPRDAAQAISHFMALVPEVLPAGRADILNAFDLLGEAPSLPARDLLHLAAMRSSGVTEILSVDAHFDGIAGMRRIDPAQWTE